jgi:hypothetical protein
MELIAEFSPIAGVIISIIAAFIAAKSASASKSSSQVAEKILHRSVMRELITSCQYLIAEELRIKTLVTDLKSEYITLATFGGALGGSRQNIFIDRLDEYHLEASEGTKDAKRLIKDQQQLNFTSDNDMDRIQVDIETKKTELQIIREAIERELVSIRQKTQLYREKIILK